MNKGLIITIILVVAPIVWLVVSLNSINSNNVVVSGDYSEMENTINDVANEYVNNSSTENQQYATQTSGESYTSKYGTPISKLIDGAKIKVDSANVYANPDTTELATGTLYKDMVVTVQDYPNGWSQVKSENLSGWTLTENILKPDEINSSLVMEETTSVGKTATITVSNTLNVRETPGGTVKDAIAGGTEVKIIGADEKEQWYQIQWGTNTGWITSNPEYVKVKE